MLVKRDNAALILEDGRIFYGKKLGFIDDFGRIGEVVFNTSMSGYQEIITDPSYKGQMVCFTYPSIGNYGINHEDNESEKPLLDGIILRDYCDIPSNFRSVMTLEQYLMQNNLAGITEVDTRALVRHIRQSGSMKGGIFTGDFHNNPELVKQSLEKIHRAPSMEGANLTKEFNGRAANHFISKYIALHKINTESYPKVAVLDFGIKHSILKHLLDVGLMPVAYAGDTPIQNWIGFSIENYSGFFLSNGPGDPASVTTGISNIKQLINSKKPIFGICLGHQMLSIALGATTYKLKFGHHGGNQPVKRSDSKRVIITAQNHGFSVENKFFESDRFIYSNGVYEINLNDKTIEGFYLKDEKILSIQYHPEAGPGPNDALYAFSQFKQMLVQ